MGNANRGVESGQSRSSERGELARAAGVLGGLTLVSRVTGLMRDVAMGAVFGTSASADAFFVAFRIPNLFRRVVAEGASSTAFVPVFTSYRERSGQREAMRAAAAVGGVAIAVLLVLTVVACVMSDQVVSLFAPGFTGDPEKRALTVRLTASVFPYLALVGMAAWAMGVLHTFRRFAVPAYGPILMNLAIVAAAVAVVPLCDVPVDGLVVGVLIGGLLQFLCQVPELNRLGLRASEMFSWRHPAVRRVGGLLVPTVVGGAVYQINILVATMFASMLPDRSVSYLWYADRLFEFPLGIVAVAVGTAALPSLSSHASAARFREMADNTGHALQLVWSMCIPATVGLWMLAPALVSVLFERGQFSSADTLMTARALRAYTVGLFGVASVRVLASVFYALERPRIPVTTAVVAFVVNALCDLSTMGPVDADAATRLGRAISYLSSHLAVLDLDHVGLALGTSVAATVNAGLLLYFARRALGGLPTSSLLRSAGQHSLAAAAMALSLFLWSLAAAFAGPRWAAYVEVAGGLAIGGATFVAASLALGSEEVRDVIDSVVARMR